MKIGAFAFKFCYSLKQTSIPSSVTEIGKSIFDCCTFLRGIHFETNSSLIIIPQKAFFSL
ncbi:hypothetical protein M9Y10_032180 [Tritrichomonas musculus]|uniref:Leucine-rich repeat domain-containing protein n=1 Tax=Tritrichomonas musculus TaxID=1915356 RepID=A0ABR2GZB2_9EUKA